MTNYKHGRYCKDFNNYCINCKIEISPNARRCRNCAEHLKNLGKNNPSWKSGKPNCVDCNKPLKSYGSKRCKSCAKKGKLNINFGNPKNIKGKLHPRYGTKHSKKTKIKMKKALAKHHIDLNKKNKKKDNILTLTSSNHAKLHNHTYEYLVKIHKIKDYIKWFDKKYKLRKF